MEGNEAAAAGAAMAFGAVFFVLMLVWLAVLIFMIIAGWKLFTKAGRPGWAAIVPIYNGYVLLKIASRPGWWIILYLIPVVSFIMWILTAVTLARNFGRGGGTIVGLIFLPVIFIPILAFGSAQYAPVQE